MPIENDLYGNTGMAGWHPPIVWGGTPLGKPPVPSGSSSGGGTMTGTPIVMQPPTNSGSSSGGSSSGGSSSGGSSGGTVGSLPGISRPPIDGGVPLPKPSPGNELPANPPGTPVQEPAPSGTGLLLPPPPITAQNSLAQLLSSQNAATATELQTLAATAANGGINEQLGPQQTYVNATQASSSPANQQRGAVVVMIVLALGVGGYFWWKHKHASTAES